MVLDRPKLIMDPMFTFSFLRQLLVFADKASVVNVITVMLMQKKPKHDFTGHRQNFDVVHFSPLKSHFYEAEFVSVCCGHEK